jgi:hypothetical protein
VLEPGSWNIHFLGRDVPKVDLGAGTKVRRLEKLTWHDYRAVLRDMHLGLSLMASPHPSYPPLDLAASGAFVVTNSWPGKQSLSAISDRIIERPPVLEELVCGIREGVRLVESGARGHGLSSPYMSTWREALDESLTWMLEVRHGV